MSISIYLITILSIMSIQNYYSLSINQPSIKQDYKWKAATYNGLTIGKSTRLDMNRVFGKPIWTNIPRIKGRPGPETLYGYEGTDKTIGKFSITVSIKKVNNKIESIWLTPENLSKDDAIKYFGNNYVQRKYSFCKEEDDDSAPIYLDQQDGSLVYLEYPNRGIALSINSSNKVADILYDKEPPGYPSRKYCK